MIRRRLLKVVTFDGTADGDWVINLGRTSTPGRTLLAENPDAVMDRVAGTSPDSLATFDLHVWYDRQACWRCADLR
ncbi:MAG: hypothetical protein WKF82_10960 [Nocardioidaceae bacterium]